MTMVKAKTELAKAILFLRIRILIIAYPIRLGEQERTGLRFRECEWLSFGREGQRADILIDFSAHSATMSSLINFFTNMGL